MRKTIVFMALGTACLLLVPLAGTASAEIIRLKNGVELHGELVQFDPETGVIVKRFDNGGIIELKWEHILDADVYALKAAHGYADMEAQPILIRAKRLLLANGDYVIGVQVESARPGVITLHRLGKDYPYLQSQVKDIETVEVEAQEIYTSEELYDQKISEAMPETALDHFKMAVFCESVAFYSRALEHYNMTVELDPEFKPKTVAQKIQQMEVKRTEKDATEHMSEIRNRLYKKKFALALELCDEFVETYPSSRQMGELEKLRGEIISKRHAHYQQQILSDYFSYMNIVAYRVASDREVTLGDAMAYARDEMGGDIREKLAEVYGMEVEEIEELWTNRKGGRLRTASYQTGTFILGEEAKEIPVLEAEEESESEEEKEEPATLDEKLKKRIEAIKKEREKQAGKRKTRLQLDDIGQSPDQWWNNTETDVRRQFLSAFYAEKSGDMKIQRVKLQKCATCNGKGWFEFFSSGDEEVSKEPCTVCKTLAIVRIVVFK